MKTSIVFSFSSLMLVVVLNLTSCGISGDPPPDAKTGPGGNIYNFDTIGSRIEAECYAKTYFLRFNDDSVSGSHWYRPLFQAANNRVIVGPVFYLQSKKNMICSMTLGYFDSLETDQYWIGVVRYDSYKNAQTAQGQSSASNKVLIPFTSIDCPDGPSLCCTKTLQRYFARADRDFYGSASIQGIQGMQATITTRWGKLCGHSSGRVDSALSGAWIGVQSTDVNVGDIAWAQVGYMQSRTPAGVRRYLYLECKSPVETSPYMAFNSIDSLVPKDGDQGYYFLFYNDSSSSWRGLYQKGVLGVLLGPIERKGDLVWYPSYGRIASWATEIMGRETDMAGTSSNPCVFRDCAYWPWLGGITYAEFSSYNYAIYSTLDGPFPQREWRIEFQIADDSLVIYDVHPLP